MGRPGNFLKALFFAAILLVAFGEVIALIILSIIAFWRCGATRKTFLFCDNVCERRGDRCGSIADRRENYCGECGSEIPEELKLASDTRPPDS
jgi:hypothetical protein